ncbi:MAG TPA: response regulator transcription factor [Verrucomicrobiae bacterium]|jgi:DNA-binding NarL/FixJ family response regulator
MSAKRAKPARPARKRILVVDDHPMTRYGMTQLLRHERDLEVCGEADNASRALASVKALKPDLVLTDLTMPDKHGLELVKDMRAMHPELAVLVVSMHDEAIYAERVLKAGGRGYIMKHAGGKQLIQAIRRVLAGHVYLSEAMAEKVLDVFPGRRSQAADSMVGRLTDREFEVFQYLGQGMTSREIGAQLHMSVKTVETHRRHARAKLHLKTAPELIKFAVCWTSSQRML